MGDIEKTDRPCGLYFDGMLEISNIFCAIELAFATFLRLKTAEKKEGQQ